MEHPNPKDQNQFRRIIIKLVLSFSVSCVLLTLLLPLFLHLFKLFLTYTIGKSYMFLLCNGLLVFIAMNSGLINTPSSSTSITTKEEKEVAFVYNINRSSSQLEELNAPEIATPLAHETVVMEIESPTPQDEEKSLEIAEQESLVVLGTELEDGDEDEANALMIIDEDVHHSAEDIEELNKKCEDFIRKMKAAIWSEPRAVYFDNRTAMVTVN